MYRVYVAEDEPPILKNIVNIINRLDMGIRVTGTSNNGRDAIEDFKVNEYDILISDIKMPFINGLELIELVRNISPDTICVILSGYSEFEYARKAIKLQVLDYLLKPIHPDILAKLLSKLVSTLEQSRKENYTKMLNNLLFGELFNDIDKNLNYFKNHRVVLVNIGSFLNDVYNLSHVGIDYWNKFNDSTIYDLFTGETEAYILSSKYPGERIIILASNQSIDDDLLLSKLYKLHKRIKTEQIVNIIYGEVVNNINQIVEEVVGLNKKLYEKIIFSESNIFDYSDMEEIISIKQSDNPLKGLKLTNKNSRELIDKECSKLINSLKDTKTRQKVLQVKLEQVMLEFFRRLSITANDIVGAATDYKELELHLTILINNIGELAEPDHFTSSSAVVSELVEYIDSNFSEEIDNKVISKLFSYNEVYISSEFKKIMGISPGKYLTKVRIDHAKELMEEDNKLLLRDISEMVGYKDALYFSRVFKTIVGVCPSQYVKNN